MQKSDLHKRSRRITRAVGFAESWTNSACLERNAIKISLEGRKNNSASRLRQRRRKLPNAFLKRRYSIRNSRLRTDSVVLQTGKKGVQHSQLISLQRWIIVVHSRLASRRDSRFATETATESLPSITRTNISFIYPRTVSHGTTLRLRRVSRGYDCTVTLVSRMYRSYVDNESEVVFRSSCVHRNVRVQFYKDEITSLCFVDEWLYRWCCRGCI